MISENPVLHHRDLSVLKSCGFPSASTILDLSELNNKAMQKGFSADLLHCLIAQPRL